MPLESVSFPFGLARESGQVEMAVRAESVRQAVRIILGTRRGERPMAPAFGSDLYRYAFEPDNSATHELIAREVTASLTRWEDRITNIEVSFSRGDGDGALTCTVQYDIPGIAGGERVSIALDLL